MKHSKRCRRTLLGIAVSAQIRNNSHKEGQYQQSDNTGYNVKKNVAQRKPPG
jgi:hypothetical protein